MRKETRKILILSVKLLLAAVLLGWLFGRVHWRSYVQEASTGRTFAVLAELPQGQLQVAEGILWWRTEQVRSVGDFAPIGDAPADVVRPGLLATLGQIDRLLLGVAAVAFVLSLFAIAVRLWYLLRLQDIHIGPWESVRLTFLGQFFNAVVPGVVGGDLVKAYYVTRHTPKVAAVLTTLFVDRVLGLTEMTLLAAVMLAIVVGGGLASVEEVRVPALAVGAILAGIAVAGTVVASGRVRRALHLHKLYRRLPFAEHLAAVGVAVRQYRANVGGLGIALAITVVAHVLFIGAIALLGVALGMHRVPWYSHFVYVPLIYIIGAVPITPGGVGLVEGAYQAFYGAMAAAPQVLALALLARIIPLLWGLPGILVVVTGPRIPRPEEMQAQLAREESAETGTEDLAPRPPSDTPAPL